MHTAVHDRLIGFIVDTVNQNEFLSQPAEAGPQQSVTSSSGSFNCFFIRLAQMNYQIPTRSPAAWNAYVLARASAHTFA